MDTISWSDFGKIDMRVGTIIGAEEFPQARKAAYRLRIDFGEIGVKASSAQITDLYTLEDLVGRQVVAVVNFPPKQIGPFVSECLVLGIVGSESGVVLLQPSQRTTNGLKIA
jgi:tRNA-binding protein